MVRSLPSLITSMISNGCASAGEVPSSEKLWKGLHQGLWCGSSKLQLLHGLSIHSNAPQKERGLFRNRQPSGGPELYLLVSEGLLCARPQRLVPCSSEQVQSREIKGVLRGCSLPARLGGACLRDQQLSIIGSALPRVGLGGFKSLPGILYF
jgi:hypothetical protein